MMRMVGCALYLWEASVLEPVQRTSLTDAVFQQLKGLITEGSIKPGGRIPSEKELCERLGVSRTAVREAKQALVMMGLLKPQAGKGTFVSDDLFAFLTEPLSWAVELERSQVNELIEARLIVETASAALAAARATEEDRENMQLLMRRQQAAVQEEDEEAFVEADLALHAAIAHAANNMVLMRTILAIRGLLRAFASAILEGPGAALAALEFHREVVEAILDGDAGRARDAMAAHLEDVRRRMLQLTAPGTSEEKDLGSG
jgi:GntR family transcriptional repressor for pyruvate dehydrogenase complex